MFTLGLKQYMDPYYQGIAAQVAFFFILSIVPTLLLLTQLLGLLDISLSALTDWLGLNPDADYMRMLEYVLDSSPQATTNAVLILMALWAASRVHFTLTRVANYTYSGGKDFKGYWRDRFRAMLTMILTIIVFAALVIIVVYGQAIINYLAVKLLISNRFDFVWRMLRWPVAAGMYLLVVAFNYYLLPTHRLKWRDIMPGSIFCALGMLIVTMIYSAYSSHAVTNDIIYGSMSSIVILMFWIYFISWVWVLGIFFNKAWMDTRR